MNTVLGTIKTSLSGAYQACGFGRYAERDLGAITDRFHRRFGLHALAIRLPVPDASCDARPGRWICMAEPHC